MSSHITFQPSGSEIKTHKNLERIADIDPRLTRSYYFDNRLLTAEDLTRDQTYIDGRLREVGLALGSGVLKGLTTTFDAETGLVDVAAGVAISQAGRVLELSNTLSLNLNDKAIISELNNGKYRRFNRGLYALAIQYTEIGTDVAEVYPTDLGNKKTFQYDLISEGVQLILVPLDFQLPQQNPLHIRAQLLHTLSNNATAVHLPEDSVALGVLAIVDDRPQWFDSELLRQPVTQLSQQSIFQVSQKSQFIGNDKQNYYRRYQNIFFDVLEQRQVSSLNGDFAASDYFNYLPAVGSLPKDSINPMTGRQGFFPEHFSVSIAPVRKAELELILQESMNLPTIDLNTIEPIDIVVLAPLENNDYGVYATKLESVVNTSTGDPGGMDLLKIRLYPKPPVHELDLDIATWQSIWDLVSNNNLVYLRRPLRIAETEMSGILLNNPSMPQPVEIPPPSPSDMNFLIDEDTVFLNRINLKMIASLRMPTTTAGESAFEELISEYGEDASVVLQILNIALRVEQEYNDVFWQTMLALAKRNQLPSFLKTLNEVQEDQEGKDQETRIRTGNVVREIGSKFNLDTSLIEQWYSIAAG